jgi:chromatin segregation and condensation protein Rec8/ScpA/Scc1 (kleisin family)
MQTLTILDWDDTLFPTTWFNNKKIMDYSLLSKLDLLLEQLLRKFATCSKTVIVTNAAMKWIEMTLDLLPSTKATIKKYKIDIISAKDMYQNRTSDMMMWKKLTFRDLVNRTNATNIISIGDAIYEFNALIELYTKKTRRILKTIRLLQSPNYDVLIDQLEVINKSVNQICNTKGYMDLKFELRT